MSNALTVPPQPPRAPVWRQPAFWLQGGLGMLAGGLVTYEALRSLQVVDGASAALVFAALVLIVWLQIVWHEAGHAIGGLLSGHRALAFGVGPLRLERQGERWRLR